MKKSLKMFLGGTIVLLAACQAPSGNAPSQASPTSAENDDTAKTMYAVSYATAKRDIDRYQEISDEIFAPDTVVRAWTIRSIDLLEAMGMPVEKPLQAKYSHVRMYMGMKEDSTIKLYLTPVVGARLSANPPIAGKDKILSGDFDGELGDDGDYFLDFTSPCPTTCP